MPTNYSRNETLMNMAIHHQNKWIIAFDAKRDSPREKKEERKEKKEEEGIESREFANDKSIPISSS